MLTNESVTALPVAEVTATDLNTAMVEFGSRQAPGAEWRQADALDLPFNNDRFDLVACQFGVMFSPRTNRPPSPRCGGPGTRRRAAAQHLGRRRDPRVRRCPGRWIQRAFPDDPPAFVATVPHGYFDLDRVVADLAAGGLGDLSTETVTLDGHADSAAGVAAGFCTGTPLRMEMAARGDLAAGTRAVAAEMTALLGDGPVTAPMTAHVVEARPS